MNVLILGSGGREHAVYLKLQESKFITKLFIAPGNAGIDNAFRFVDLDINNFFQVLQVVQKHKIEFIFVGPEQPLSNGIVDFFKKESPATLVFGPNKLSAQLESSKIFANEFIKKANLPVCRSAYAYSLQEALKEIETFSVPVVIKADGLAAGKGVSIHQDYSSAQEKIHAIFENKIFGESGSAIIIQEFMTGTEASVFVIMNGKEGIFLPTAQDYKAAFDGGKGDNTGGMGSVCPGQTLTEDHLENINNSIVKQVAEHFSYIGVLYIGLMVHSSLPHDYSIVEFNCRLGDPETQSVLPMLETDLFPYLLWACQSPLPHPLIKMKKKNYFHIPYKSGFCVNVVLVAHDYPADYEKNIPLSLPQHLPENIHLVHAGTSYDPDGNYISTGGRILNIVGFDKSITKVRHDIYTQLEKMADKNDFTRLRYRKDVGKL